MRKLATIRTIEALDPIPNADAIELATVGGWKVVAQKGLYRVGDPVLYLEIDSWVPTELAPFLSKGKEPRVFEGIQGERLRTIKLRGQLSQGLLIPLEIKMSGNCLPITRRCVQVGEDVSEELNVIKWEKPINAQLAGVCKGNFPSLIPKTDQERVQNLKKEVAAARELTFEVTEKLEGSSMTCYLIEGEFGVCSRNMDLKESEGNSFWSTARRENVEEKMRTEFGLTDFAVQGELIGPGIQGNIYKLSEPMFYVFDIYDIRRGVYVDPATRSAMVKSMELNHVPVIWHQWKLDADVDTLLAQAEGASWLNKEQEREGIVFKQIDGGMTFKAISNKYLLGEK